MDKSIFRAYDIRGVYPSELNEADAYRIAHGIFEYLGAPKVVALGHDARLAAPAIHGAMAQAFIELGAKVLNLGLVSSDVRTFVTGRGVCDAAVIVTASHNPKEWIGMKVSRSGGREVGGGGEIQEIQAIVETNYLDKKYVARTYNFEGLNILPDWIEHVLSQVDKKKIKPFKIVVDAGNGVAGPIVRELAQSLSLRVEEMYFEPDGNFPNHLPSPIEPENVADLQKRVTETGADLGMAFDGDADRIFLIDEKGGIVTGSETTAMLLDAILTQDPTRVVLYNAVCGWNVQDVVQKHGATAYRTKVGHGFIKKDMEKYDAYFAGEHSGHYFFRNSFNADSGLVAAVMILELLSTKGQTLTELLHEHRKYYSIPETNFKVRSVEEVLMKLEAEFRDAEIDKLDGLTIRTQDWWCSIRPSSNEPLLRLNLEARTRLDLDNMQKRLTDLICQFEPCEAAT
ncbi:MAG: phosphomannomutase/phosphoglucomutase [Patescibacteria group bacterium]|nr:phosphomannomutase/phosphoglucomutase [Patescibacteria group bacterium]